MNSRAKMAILAFSMISLLLAPMAEAARMGKGRSSGMRRAAPTQSYQQQAAPMAPQPAPAQVPPQQQKKGVGIGTAVAAGAAGAAVGYLAGSAMSNKANAAPATSSAPAAAVAEQAPQQPSFPWHWIILLGAVFLIGLVWFRRRMAMPEHAPQAMRPTPPAQQPLAGDNRFDPIPAIGSGFPGNGGNAAPNPAFDNRRLPDGTEVPYFLRQAKGIFLHLQSLNSPDAVNEVRRYMTPELFEELRNDIANNQTVADFTDLDCQLVESGEENSRIFASVRFVGLVSEEVNAAPVPFSETWHFIKTVDTSGKWIVAGIQQN